LIISNSASDILAEDVTSLNYMDTIVFRPVYRNVAIYHIGAYPNQVYSGEPVNINVTAANEGEKLENFTVGLYYRETQNLVQEGNFLGVPNEPHPANALWIEPYSSQLRLANRTALRTFIFERDTRWIHCWFSKPIL